uniref:Uncharacterized protein n=1 Tax=Anguilla anguilla TaxID=7936 RepID=A0A0E9PQR4_ANGAN
MSCVVNWGNLDYGIRAVLRWISPPS